VGKCAGGDAFESACEGCHLHVCGDCDGVGIGDKGVE